MQPVQPGHRLHLLRHAKSDWDDRSLPDHDRPLAPRGRRATALLADLFRRTGLSVDLVLCSSALRTRQTWDRVRGGLTGEPEVRMLDALYAAPAADVLEVVQAVPTAIASVLVIGHNPGIEEFATRLAGSGDPATLAELRRGFPTGGFASFTPEVGWADLGWGTARLDDFVRPRDLARK